MFAVIVPADVRRAIEEHARREAPDEACGVVVLRDGRAVRYVPGRNLEASPHRYRLEVDPEVWFLEDEGYELAVCHSHPAEAPTGARPSRTDIENIGLWEGRPYLILSLADGELAAFRIADGRAEPLELRSP